MKSNHRIGTLGRFKALPIMAAALATFAQPVSADSGILNRASVYEETIARPTWPHHVEMKFVTPHANGEHPAVIVARKFDLADYQSQLRLHPAGLALAAQPPQPVSDQPQTASLKLE